MNRQRITPRPKYGNRKVTRDGIQFDSIKEANRYEQLKHEQMAGAISTLELQKRIKLFAGSRPLKYANGRQAVYVADFFYFDEQRQHWVIEDTKGFRTAEFKLKRAIVEAMTTPMPSYAADHLMFSIHYRYCCDATPQTVIFKET